MIADRLIEAFDNGEPGDKWRAFCRATILAVRATENASPNVDRLARAADALWEQRSSPEVITAHKVAVWQFLDAKHGGDSTAVVDAEDRALRALLGALEPGGARDEAVDSALWAEEFLTDSQLEMRVAEAQGPDAVGSTASIPLPPRPGDRAQQSWFGFQRDKLRRVGRRWSRRGRLGPRPK